MTWNIRFLKQNKSLIEYKLNICVFIDIICFSYQTKSIKSNEKAIKK